MAAKFVILCAGSLTQALNVIQWQDNMVLPAGKFLELRNENEASVLSDEPPSLVQHFQLDLVSPSEKLTHISRQAILRIAHSMF